MARKSLSSISTQFTKKLLKKHDFNPKDILHTINSLDKHPDICRIELTCWAAGPAEMSFGIIAQYDWPEKMIQNTDGQKDRAIYTAREFFKKTAEHTGLEFSDARAAQGYPPLYIAQVRVAEYKRIPVEISEKVGKPSP